MARGAVDERGFEVIRRLRAAGDRQGRLPLPAFKALVREQFLMLLVDEEAALAALPGLLPPDAQARRAALDTIRTILEGSGPIEDEVAARLARISAIFDPADEPGRKPRPVAV